MAPDSAPLVREALTHLAAPARLLLVGDPGSCQALAPGDDAGTSEPAVGSPLCHRLLGRPAPESGG